MTNDPDNIVLRLLRDIRSKLDEHDKRFDQTDKKLDLMQFQQTHALGLAGMANLTAQHTGGRVDAIEERQRRLEETVAEVSRKVAAMETRLDS